MKKPKIPKEEIIDKRAIDRAWSKIFEVYNLNDYDFEAAPFSLTASQVRQAVTGLGTTTEPRILCKRDTRESRPRIFQERGLFILPITNGTYSIIKGEGYIDIPPTSETIDVYMSKLSFELVTSKVGDSEMQHLDFAYASSLFRTLFNDESLVLTIRGKKRTPSIGFRFNVGKHEIEAKSVQTEVDAGYEGREQIVLIEAKSRGQKNTIIRQLYYPFRQWQHHSTKQVKTIFFDKSGDVYRIWQFEFRNPNDYNSIEIVKAQSFHIKENF